jgi:hypothetical protein
MNQTVATRLHHGSLMASTPSTRCQLDGVAVGVSHRSIRSARAPDSLVDYAQVTPDLSARGVYACRLCRAGEWRVVYVDELLPVRRDGRAAFCQVATALWPALVEKARPRRLMSRRWRTATLQPLANAGVRKDFWVL